MEASGAVAPAAADTGGQVQAPPPAQGAPAPTQSDPNAPQNDFDPQAELTAMKEQVAALQAQLGQQQGEQPDDLLTALQGEPEDFGLTPEELATLGGEEQAQVEPAEQEQQLAELESYIKGLAQEQAQELVNPILEAQRTAEVQSWQKEHPDVTPGSDLFKSIVETMDGLAGRYQNDAVAYDTNLLDMAYTAAKAKLADAGAVPAEQAGADGASLETGAGQTQTGADSEADNYRKALVSRADNPLA